MYTGEWVNDLREGKGTYKVRVAAAAASTVAAAARAMCSRGTKTAHGKLLCERSLNLMATLILPGGGLGQLHGALEGGQDAWPRHIHLGRWRYIHRPVG